MTAAQIISEIKALSPEQQAGVVRAFMNSNAERKLSGPGLSMLAQRLVQAGDPTEDSRVREPIFAASTAPGTMLKIRRRNLPPALLQHLLDCWRRTAAAAKRRQ